MAYTEITFESPLRGLNVQMPENKMDRGFSPLMENFYIRNQELLSFPALKRISSFPDDGTSCRGMFSFVDTNNLYHTVAVTEVGFYQFVSALANTGRTNYGKWVLVDMLKAQGSSEAVTFWAFDGVLYFCNGSSYLYSWTGLGSAGISVVATISTPSAGTPVGAFFLSELDSHLIMLATNEGGVIYPRRFRWSAADAPTIWDPTVNTDAGYVDAIDVPDIITGFFTIGLVGYILRSNGITEVVPTGSGINPFDFDHLWASSRGIGNVIMSSAAQYGNTGIFVATDNIYQLSGQAPTPIGGMARDAIMADLAVATDTIMGSITPTLANGFVFYSYFLSIPQGSGSVIYIYSLEDNTWVKKRFKSGAMTCKPHMVMVN